MQRSQFRTHLHRVIIWARMTDTRVLLDPGERDPAARFSAARVMRAMIGITQRRSPTSICRSLTS
jgi:hypothetical protein